MGKSKKKKYFTLMETIWKLGAPIIVAVGKTLLENKLPKFLG